MMLHGGGLRDDQRLDKQYKGIKEWNEQQHQQQQQPPPLQQQHRSQRQQQQKKTQQLEIRSRPSILLKLKKKRNENNYKAQISFLRFSGQRFE